MKQHHIIRLALLTLACVLFLVTKAPAQIATRQLVCPPGPIPAGRSVALRAPQARVTPAA